MYWVVVRSCAPGVSLNLKRIAGTRSTPDTAAREASGAPATAIGAFRAPKFRRDRSRARRARTARAWRRHTPSLRKSNPRISRRTRGGGACWARLTPGTVSAETTVTSTSERDVTEPSDWKRESAVTAIYPKPATPEGPCLVSHGDPRVVHQAA